MKLEQLKNLLSEVKTIEYPSDPTKPFRANIKISGENGKSDVFVVQHRGSNTDFLNNQGETETPSESGVKKGMFIAYYEDAEYAGYYYWNIGKTAEEAVKTLKEEGDMGV